MILWGLVLLRLLILLVFFSFVMFVSMLKSINISSVTASGFTCLKVVYLSSRRTPLLEGIGRGLVFVSFQGSAMSMHTS